MKNLAITALAQNEHGNLGRGGNEHSEAQVKSISIRKF